MSYVAETVERLMRGRNSTYYVNPEQLRGLLTESIRLGMLRGAELARERTQCLSCSHDGHGIADAIEAEADK